MPHSYRQGTHARTPCANRNGRDSTAGHHVLPALARIARLCRATPPLSIQARLLNSTDGQQDLPDLAGCCPHASIRFKTARRRNNARQMGTLAADWRSGEHAGLIPRQSPLSTCLGLGARRASAKACACPGLEGRTCRASGKHAHSGQARRTGKGGAHMPWRAPARGGWHAPVKVHPLCAPRLQGLAQAHVGTGTCCAPMRFLLAFPSGACPDIRYPFSDIR